MSHRSFSALFALAEDADAASVVPIVENLISQLKMYHSSSRYVDDHYEPNEVFLVVIQQLRSAVGHQRNPIAAQMLPELLDCLLLFPIFKKEFFSCASLALAALIRAFQVFPNERDISIPITNAIITVFKLQHKQSQVLAKHFHDLRGMNPLMTLFLSDPCKKLVNNSVYIISYALMAPQNLAHIISKNQIPNLIAMLSLYLQTNACDEQPAMHIFEVITSSKLAVDVFLAQNTNYITLFFSVFKSSCPPSAKLHAIKALKNIAVHRRGAHFILNRIGGFQPLYALIKNSFHLPNFRLLCTVLFWHLRKSSISHSENTAGDILTAVCMVKLNCIENLPDFNVSLYSTIELCDHDVIENARLSSYKRSDLKLNSLRAITPLLDDPQIPVKPNGSFGIDNAPSPENLFSPDAAFELYCTHTQRTINQYDSPSAHCIVYERNSPARHFANDFTIEHEYEPESDEEHVEGDLKSTYEDETRTPEIKSEPSVSSPQSFLNSVCFEVAELNMSEKRLEPLSWVDSFSSSALPHNNSLFFTDSLVFDSQFECGNLQRAIRTGNTTYDLVLQFDTNALGHAGWFNFRIKGMKKGEEYTFNIINMEKPFSSFRKGMKPVMYSMQRFKDTGLTWTRASHISKLCYFRNFNHRLAQMQYPTKESLNHLANSSSDDNLFYFTLTFSLRFEYDDDIVQMAYFYPFTLSFQDAILNFLSSRANSSNFFLRQNICSSRAGNPVDIITITNFESSTEVIRKRPVVFFTGRIHPGEHPASWMLKGAMEYLCSSQAAKIRDNMVFKIVPMLNPDGVVEGNMRTSLTGNDLNRRWIEPKEHQHPSLFYTKSVINDIAKQGRLLLFCDFHAHSQISNIICYGCDPLNSDIQQDGESMPRIKANYSNFIPWENWRGQERLFPALCARLAPDLFSLVNSNFKVQNVRAGSARIAFWKELNLVHSFTSEATYCNSNSDIHLSPSHYELMGSVMVQACHHLHEGNSALLQKVFNDVHYQITSRSLPKEYRSSSKPPTPTLRRPSTITRRASSSNPPPAPSKLASKRQVQTPPPRVTRPSSSSKKVLPRSVFREKRGSSSVSLSITGCKPPITPASKQNSRSR